MPYTLKLSSNIITTWNNELPAYFSSVKGYTYRVAFSFSYNNNNNNKLQQVTFLLLLTLTTTDHFIIFTVLFWDCSIVGIIQYIAFSGWLLLLSNMHLGFFMSYHALIAHFFLALNNILLCAFIYPFTYWKTFCLPTSLEVGSCYTHLCSGFYVHMGFQLLRVNTKKHVY